MRSWTCLASVTLLAACGERGDGDGAPAGLEAGEWKIEYVIYSTLSPSGGAVAPGPDPFVVSTRLCLAPGRGQRPDPAFFHNPTEGDCTYRSLEIDQGRIEAELACRLPGAGGRPFSVAVRGRYGARQFDVAARPQRALPFVRFHTGGRLVGPCRSAAAKA